MSSDAGGRPAMLSSGRGGSARRLTAALLLSGCAIATLAGAAGDKPPLRTVYPAAFPNGEGRDIADRACRVCHSAMLITQQAKDSTGWEKTITQMEKWGVTLSPAEHDTLSRYLVARFGPRRVK